MAKKKSYSKYRIFCKDKEIAEASKPYNHGEIIQLDYVRLFVMYMKKDIVYTCIAN